MLSLVYSDNRNSPCLVLSTSSFLVSHQIITSYQCPKYLDLDLDLETLSKGDTSIYCRHTLEQKSFNEEDGGTSVIMHIQKEFVLYFGVLKYSMILVCLGSFLIIPQLYHSSKSTFKNGVAGVIRVCLVCVAAFNLNSSRST